MARKSLPVITITIIMLLVLATAGVAYGLWSEKLVIDGMVHTGNVDVEFSGPYFVNEYVKIGKWYYHEPWWKDVTTCEAFLGDYAPDDGDIGEFLTVNVTGAYPGYYCAVMFDIHSTGTVPVHVSRPEQIGGPDWVNVYTCYPDWVQLHQYDSVYGWVVLPLTTTWALKNSESMNSRSRLMLGNGTKPLRQLWISPKMQAIVSKCLNCLKCLNNLVGGREGI